MNIKKILAFIVLPTLLVAVILPAFGALKVSADLTVNLTIAFGFSVTLAFVKLFVRDLLFRGKGDPSEVAWLLLYMFSPALLLLLAGCLLPAFITVQIGFWATLGLSLGWSVFEVLLIKALAN